MDSKDDNRTLYDKDIREPLFDFLEEQYGKVRILEEKNIGRVRADVVMITEDALYGMQLKKPFPTGISSTVPWMISSEGTQVSLKRRYCFPSWIHICRT